MSSPLPDRARGSRRGKRAAERKPSRWAARPRSGKDSSPPGLAVVAALTTEAPDEPEREPTPTPEPGERVVVTPHGPPRALIAGWLAAGLMGTVALVAAALGAGPEWLDSAGAVVVVTVLAWLLAARTASRAMVAAGVTLALALLAVLAGGRALPTGAAVMTCALGGVYAVMATVPAVTYWKAVREVAVATVISGVTALAAVGFEPVVSTTRFDLVSLIIALVLCGAVVHRLGAGLHGLGRRGLVAVVVAAVVLVATLAYAELLQRYGSQGMVSSVLDFVDATSDRIGAFPRPLVALLGLPALIWGTHLRARRRQGWWVCAFGVAATVPMAAGLVPPDDTFLEAALRALYSLAIGLPLGYLVIRADLALTGSRGQRGRRAEEAAAHRPEPARFGEL